MKMLLCCVNMKQGFSLKKRGQKSPNVSTLIDLFSFESANEDTEDT